MDTCGDDRREEDLRRPPREARGRSDRFCPTARGVPLRLFAISDLHLRFEANRAYLHSIRPHPEDWLILGGDLGETEEHLKLAFSSLAGKFARLVWVPGNHELWTVPRASPLRGEARYQRLVSICRDHHVLTPEDPYPTWPGDGPARIVAPLFTLYDYSFRPAGVPAEGVIDWALETGILCTDEALLDPDPFPSRAAWCAERCKATEERLTEASARAPLVLVDHYPLREDLVRIPAAPRFLPWCGTKRTEDWHLRFRAAVVVYGHLHVPGTSWRDSVRFEEVSLGYPENWRTKHPELRLILPEPESR